MGPSEAQEPFSLLLGFCFPFASLLPLLLPLPIQLCCILFISMECSGGSGFAVVGCMVRKRRSSVSRRPRPDAQLFSTNYDFTIPPGQPLADGNNSESQIFGNSTTLDGGLGHEKKLKKLKLTLCGVTHTIRTKSLVDLGPNGGSSVASLAQGNGSQEVRWDAPRPDANPGMAYSSTQKMSGESVHTYETYIEPVRKSKRVPKRRVLDIRFGYNDSDDDGDDELRYLGRLNASRVIGAYNSDKVCQMNDGMHVVNLRSAWSGQDARRSRSEKLYGDNDYVGEESTSDDEHVSEKKPRKESLNLFIEQRNELTPTTRNRALKSTKYALSASATSPIKFPTGLPPGLPSKQKGKLSDVDEQLRKTEAAKRRKMQSEKAAKEAEAEAIRKILGQVSGRKKREEKMKKHWDELAEKKAANAAELACSTVRWVIGPAGTTVTFSEDVGLPSIFNPVSCGYPPPREKCAGPNCTNEYKYRDSKTKLPLCSLNCYRAVQRMKQDLIAC